MKTEEIRSFQHQKAANEKQNEQELNSPEMSNSAAIHLLRARTEESLKAAQHTTVRTEKTEDEHGSFNYAIDIERSQTVRLGKSDDGEAFLVSTNPKGREDYHRTPKTAVKSDHNEIAADIGTAGHTTAELKIDRSEEEDFRGFADKTANDVKLSKYGGGTVEMLGSLGTEREKGILSDIRELKHSIKYPESKTELERVENRAETALEKKQQLDLSVKTKTDSIINTLDTDVESGDGFFDILLKRRRASEESEQAYEDDSDKFEKEESDEEYS